MYVASVTLADTNGRPSLARAAVGSEGSGRESGWVYGRREALCGVAEEDPSRRSGRSLCYGWTVTASGKGAEAAFAAALGAVTSEGAGAGTVLSALTLNGIVVAPTPSLPRPCICDRAS